MFADLMDPAIQPEKIKAGSVPEIELSEELRLQLKGMLEEEEKAYAKVSGKTSVVQTDKNFVFFSNQWFYLAVKCKNYAMALYPYFEFFDERIKTDPTVLRCFINKNYEEEAIQRLFENETDRERMIRFICGGTDFRPGKNLLNDNKTRSRKDTFGSCVLGKLAVPNASSAYLGNLVYYLVRNPEVYNQLEAEIRKSYQQEYAAIKLPLGIKDCAKAIIDWVYKNDTFDKLKPYFEVNEKNIKINTSKIEGDCARGNFLRYLFARPNSELYNADHPDKVRVFTDKTYVFEIHGHKEACRLTTEWVDLDISQAGQGNYLRALIEVINICYDSIIKITEEAGERYLVLLNPGFSLKNLPAALMSDFTRRFVTALLAKPFVILTGNSGSGKTRVAKQFAEYLEVDIKENEKNWEIVPVGADWTDNTKILGFYNPLANEGKGEYVETKIFKLIKNANENRNIPYFLILDEMNLSHVERYFSDFLSHMETPELSFILDGYEGELKFPSNLFVIGTVNIDETTYMFSPKVLDRANVVEFKPEKAAVMDLFLHPAGSNKIYAAKDGSAEAFLRLSMEIRSGKCEAAAQMNEVKELFDKIYGITEKSEFEFAYRTVKEIRQYISAAYEIAGEKQEFNLMQAVDEQILQKVLPKLHGNKKEIGELLAEFEEICDEHNMILSGKKIKQMKGKLAKTQYASFI